MYYDYRVAQLIFVVSILYYSLGGSQSSEYLISNPNYGGVIEKARPAFKLPPRVYKEEFGNTVLLECKVINLGNHSVKTLKS